MLRTETSREFTFTVDELAIDLSPVAGLVSNGTDSSSGEVPEIVTGVYNRARREASITCGYTLFGRPGVNAAPYTLTLEGESFHVGERIFSQMRRSEMVAVFYCTAGPKPELLSRKWQEEGDFIRSYVMDSLCALIIEYALDAIQEHLEKEAGKMKWSVTNRFSPGYCHWDTADRKKVHGLFPKKFCRLKVNGSEVQDPARSLCGIIGLGKEVSYQPYHCSHCTTLNCMMRRNRKLETLRTKNKIY